MTNSPTSQINATRPRAHARIALALFLGMTLFFVAITFSPLKSGFADAADRGPGDIQLYRAEVDRVHAGESYYDAAAVELRERGYPRASVFNWRTPLPVWIVGQLSDIGTANAILGGLGYVLVCLSFHLLAQEAGVRQAALGALLLVGAIMPCLLGDLVVMSELWSGVLIALSAVCFGIQRTTAGVVAAVAALFFRELAAPYVLVCLALAAGGRRYRELALWAAGLAAYAAFFGAHVWQVLPRASGADIAQVHGWIRFGGAGFLISTAQMNAFLIVLPQWVSAIYLPAVLAGCATWNTPAGRRIGWTIALYAIAFSAVGNDFNQYWGSMTAPLYCLAACRLPATIRQWWTAAQFLPLSGGNRLATPG
jgi:hypothetical protein